MKFNLFKIVHNPPNSAVQISFHTHTQLHTRFDHTSTHLIRSCIYTPDSATQYNNTARLTPPPDPTASTPLPVHPSTHIPCWCHAPHGNALVRDTTVLYFSDSDEILQVEEKIRRRNYHATIAALQGLALKGPSVNPPSDIFFNV